VLSKDVGTEFIIASLVRASLRTSREDEDGMSYIRKKSCHRDEASSYNAEQGMQAVAAGGAW
jgi:hypothetical protein